MQVLEECKVGALQGLSEEVIFELRPNGRKGARHGKFGEKSLPGRRNPLARALRWA